MVCHRHCKIKVNIKIVLWIPLAFDNRLLCSTKMGNRNRTGSVTQNFYGIHNFASTEVALFLLPRQFFGLLKCWFGGQKHSSRQLPQHHCALHAGFGFRQFYLRRRARALKVPLGYPAWVGIWATQPPGHSPSLLRPRPQPPRVAAAASLGRGGPKPAGCGGDGMGGEGGGDEGGAGGAGRAVLRRAERGGPGPPPPSGGRRSAPLARPARGCRERLHALVPAVRSRGGAQPGGGSGARGGRPRPAAVAAHGSAGGRAAEACGPLALPEAAAPAGEGARRRRPLLRRRQQLRLRVGGAAVAAPAPRRLPAGGCYGPLGERRGLPGLEVSATPAPRRLLLR